ncbi:glucose 1-dehydrogenase [Leptolyngbya sp. 15MV]|nr:glucose 1-dehydrogenase [Leptolyngbya sp. 15MV]
MCDFDGKVVLVTGAGSGMGRAAARLFAARGARVAVAGRRQAALEQVSEEIRTVGGEALVLPADIAEEAQVDALIVSTLAAWGRLDAAFNNAGIEGAFAPITDLTAADFDATMRVNLRGAWLCIRAEMRAMRRLGQPGAIVNTSSWLAHGAFPGSSIYSASKAALDGMVRALAQEGAAHGIRVNNVNPGIIDTPMLRRFGDDAAFRPFIDHTPLRRLGTAEEVAQAVLWLCSDAARFVTGQTLLVDGGYAIPGHRAWLSGEITSDTSRTAA